MRKMSNDSNLALFQEERSFLYQNSFIDLSTTTMMPAFFANNSMTEPVPCARYTAGEFLMGQVGGALRFMRNE